MDRGLCGEPRVRDFVELSEENEELEILDIYLRFPGFKTTENVSKFYF